MSLITIKKIEEAPLLRQEMEKLKEDYEKQIEDLEKENKDLRNECYEWRGFASKFFKESGLIKALDRLEERDYYLKPKRTRNGSIRAGGKKE